MATLPPTGSISLSQIYSVFGKTLGPSISLTSASTGVYGAITASSPFKPDGVPPHAMSEFRGYNHSTADTTPPSIPNGLSCNYGTGSPRTSIAIRWDASTDNLAVTGYQLQRSDSGGTTWSTVYNGPNISYQDSGSPNREYHYQVRAFDAIGNYSNYSGPAYWKTEAGTSCFVEGTLITLADNIQIPIETLVTNQLLISAEIDTLKDTNNVNELYKWSSNYLSENRIISPVANIEPKVASKTIIINKGLLEATPYHSQLIQRNGIWKFIPLRDVIVGDRLYNINKEIIAITSVIINLEKRTVYPLTLSPSHTYFANGILTHNMKKPDEL
ncbi:hypothetical protein OIU80_05610 [Flavobacterium sp. LS1R47]|uniref:Fibronectin type-III domain-containing protein n=1 Tax=Flavobacterium frigoritolerans TaxID=2987686 RepID=A0A9X3C8K3_9FLAO|nr:hypothetical protein [Flavobacterium frigoritolerans]MCV9931753.1 hypothetical protein [Flavobacterium frigoritolerans]